MDPLPSSLTPDSIEDCHDALPVPDQAPPPVKPTSADAANMDTDKVGASLGAGLRNDSWGLDIKEEELVGVKVKGPQSNIDGDDKEIKIHKAEAVCRFCFNVFEEDNVLKTKCRCEQITLAHENCATEWSAERGNSKCPVCEQDVQNRPVTLSNEPDHFSSTPATSGGKLKILNLIPKRFRGWLGRMF